MTSIMNGKSILRTSALVAVAAALMTGAGGAVAQPNTGSSGSGSASPGTGVSDVKVVVIGIDGAMYDKIVEAKAPNLLRLASEGAVGQSSIAPHTTVSGPSWSSVLTGVWDTKHGIKDNGFDATPFATWPTVFTRLETAKPELRTQSVATWPNIAIIAGSGVPADSNVVSPPQLGDPTGAKVDAVTGDTSAAAIRDQGPDFLFVHLDQVDAVGHANGSASPRFLDALRSVDREVGKIVSAVDARSAANPAERWQIIVTTDHGHTPTGGHGGQTPEETANFVIARGSAFPAGAATANSLIDITPTALDLLGVPADPALDGTSFATSRR